MELGWQYFVADEKQRYNVLIQARKVDFINISKLGDKTGSFRLGNILVQWGSSKKHLAVNAGYYSGYFAATDIVFPKAYKSMPHVSVMVEEGSSLFSFNVVHVETTKVSGYVHACGSYDARDICFNWLAIGEVEK